MAMGYIMLMIFVVIGCIISYFFGALPAMLFLSVMIGISFLVKNE